jgi:hypothetical protein
VGDDAENDLRRGLKGLCVTVGEGGILAVGLIGLWMASRLPKDALWWRALSLARASKLMIDRAC